MSFDTPQAFIGIFIFIMIATVAVGVINESVNDAISELAAGPAALLGIIMIIIVTGIVFFIINTAIGSKISR